MGCSHGLSPLWYIRIDMEEPRWAELSESRRRLNRRSSQKSSGSPSFWRILAFVTEEALEVTAAGGPSTRGPLRPSMGKRKAAVFFLLLLNDKMFIAADGSAYGHGLSL